MKYDGYSSALVYPEEKTVIKVFDALTKVGELYGDLSIGKKLRSLFGDAGLKNTAATASCESYGNSKSLREITQYMSKQLEEPEVRHLILTNNWVTEEELNQSSKTLENRGLTLSFK